MMTFVLQYGWSPLYTASHTGHLDIVKTLIEAGANVNQATKSCGGIDKDLEDKGKTCHLCQANATSLAYSTLHLGVPDELLSRLHIDFTDPFIGKHFIILVDVHSKWLENSSCQITAVPYKQRVQNLSHLQWSYHSSSNSLAERCVQTLYRGYQEV
eukprot:Em0023g672a